MRNKTFLAAGAAVIVGVSGAFAYTNDIDTVTVTQPGDEVRDYITMVPSTATPDSPLANITTDSGLSVQPVYGHQPAWSRVADGTSAVSSEIQEAGDIAYLDTTSLDSTDEGDILGAIAFEGMIANAPELFADYSNCQIPLKVRVTTDNGSSWSDVTNTYFDVDAGEAHYLDCTDSQFDFVVGEADLDKIFAISVEQGGAMMPRDNSSTFASPVVAMASTPVGALSSVAMIRSADDCASGFTFANNQCEGTFTSGSSSTFSVPSGVKSLSFTLTGGSGGNGGPDGSSPGGSGSVGGQVSGTLSVAGGDVIAFGAGTAGGDGRDSAPSGANNAFGPRGVNPLDANYNGGLGALAGPSGSSGSGGGGGAATVLRWTDLSASSTVDIVAAGGGGGGGAGAASGFNADTTFAGYDPTKTAGDNGDRAGGDAGGGGGGGGGAEGGRGGIIVGDAGGGGHIGKNSTAGVGGVSEGLAGVKGDGVVTITY